jgi:hypothetical protein
MALPLAACASNDNNTEVILSGTYVPKDSAAAGVTLADGSVAQYFTFSGDNVSTDIHDALVAYVVKDGKMTFGEYSLDFHKYEKSIFLNGVEFVKGERPFADSESVGENGIAEDTSVAHSNVNNIVNLGYAASTDDFVYYSYGEPGLFRMRHDGSDKIKLCGDTALYLNIANGWIYYQKAGGDKAIYKIRTNGTQRTPIKSGYFENVIVYGDWIYYLDKITEAQSYTAISRMKTDGTEVERLTNGQSGTVRSFVVSFDKIYMIATNLGDDGLYKINLDGSIDGDDDDVYSNVKSICATDSAEYPIIFTVEGADSALYVCNGKTAYNSGNAKQLSENANAPVNYYDGSIYWFDGFLWKAEYTDTRDLDRQGVYSPKTPTSKAITDFNIVESRIFFCDITEMPLYYFMDTDGANITPLISTPSDGASAADVDYTHGLEAVIPKASSFSVPDNPDSNYDIPFMLMAVNYRFAQWMVSNNYMDNYMDSGGGGRLRWVLYDNHEAVMASVDSGEVDVAFIPAEYFDALPNKDSYRSVMSDASNAPASTAPTATPSAVAPATGTAYEIVYAPYGGATPSAPEVDATKYILEYRLKAQDFTVNDIQFDENSRLFTVKFTCPSGLGNPDAAASELGAMAALTFRDPNGNVILQDADIVSAAQDYSSDAGYFVQVELSKDAQRKFADATERLNGQQISICLDEAVLSAPTVNGRVDTATVVIAGGFTSEQATRLAALIDREALPFKLEVISWKNTPVR